MIRVKIATRPLKKQIAMTPYAQLPKNNPEEFMRTVGLSKEDFQHLNEGGMIALLLLVTHIRLLLK